MDFKRNFKELVIGMVTLGKRNKTITRKTKRYTTEDI